MKAISLKPFLILTLMIIIISGVKNTFEMNSSSISSHGFNTIKTVDELTDHLNFNQSKKTFSFEEKLAQRKMKNIKIKKSVNSSPKIRRIEQKVSTASAYIQDDLTLKLIEYYNPKKNTGIIKVGTAESMVSGVLEAANGFIEKIDVTLPNGENLFIQYGELSENRFKYTISGENLRGLIYKVDALTYMVSLDEGPYAGTRMKFKNTIDIDPNYEEPVDSKVLEASLAAQESGFTF